MPMYLITKENYSNITCYSINPIAQSIGSYCFDNHAELFDFVVNQNTSYNYFFKELPTSITHPFFKLDTKLELSNATINPTDFINHLITIICEKLDCFEYILAKNILFDNAHLYFPNISISIEDLIKLIGLIKIELVKLNYFNIDPTNVEMFYDNIFDQSVYKTGISLPYQLHPSKSYYVDIQNSTLSSIPTNRLELLKLCSVRI